MAIADSITKQYEQDLALLGAFDSVLRGCAPGQCPRLAQCMLEAAPEEGIRLSVAATIAALQVMTHVQPVVGALQMMLITELASLDGEKVRVLADKFLAKVEEPK